MNSLKVRIISVFIVSLFVATTFGLMQNADSAFPNDPVLYEFQFSTGHSSGTQSTDFIGITGDGMYAYTYQGFYSIAQGEYTYLGDNANVNGMSSDPLVVAGAMENTTDDKWYVGYWTPDGGWEQVYLDGFRYGQNSNDIVVGGISGNGRFITGYTWTTSWKYHGFLYDIETNTTTELLHATDPANTATYPRCISYDGTVVGGSASGGSSLTHYTPILWVNGVQEYPLGYPISENWAVSAISGDGTKAFVYERDFDSGNIAAKRYTIGGGLLTMENHVEIGTLGSCPDRVTSSNWDGTKVIGVSWWNQYWCDSWIWEATGGDGTMNHLSSYYQSNSVPEPHRPWDWFMGPAGISDDGNTMGVRVFLGPGEGSVSYMVFMTPPETYRPSSYITAIPMGDNWYTGATVSLEAQCTNAITGVANVDIFYRYRATETSAWGAWTDRNIPDTTHPYTFTFNFPSGDGFYEIASVATDGTSWVEPLPSSADMKITRGTGGPPVATVDSNTPYAYTVEPIPMSITLSNVGVLGVKDQIDLYWRWTTTNNSGWSNWTPVGSNEGQPDVVVDNFGFRPSRAGLTTPGTTYYIEFFSLASDEGGHKETYTTIVESRRSYTVTAGKSSYPFLVNGAGVDPFFMYNSNGNSFVYAAATTGAGTDVTLWYRYSTDNSSWGSWTITGQSYNGQSFYFNPTSPGVGEGYYQFYTQATGAGGESVPSGNEAKAVTGLLEYSDPSSSVDTITPDPQTSAPVTVDVSITSSTYAGVMGVKLYYQYSVDGSSNGGWVEYDYDDTLPYSFSFGCPNGPGYYDFLSIAVGPIDDEYSDYGAYFPTNGTEMFLYQPTAPATSYDYSLVNGWNYVSIPTDETLTIAQLEGKITGANLEAVQYFDTTAGTWQFWNDAMETAGITQTLSNVDHKMGFFIEVDSTGTISFDTGEEPVSEISRNVTLIPGWNMVGYASDIDRTVESAFGELWTSGKLLEVQELDGSDATYMSRGTCYWVYLDGGTNEYWVTPYGF